MKAANDLAKAHHKKSKTMTMISRILRWTILASLLTFVLAASTLHVLGYVAPSIHAICPYGGLESMLSIVTVGTFVKKIFLGTYVLFIVTVALAVLLRRSFCGQICAFGGLQEFFGKIGRKLFKKRPILPTKMDRILRYLKYVVLAVTILMAWITAQLWITPFDPFNALSHLADFNALLSTYLIGFVVLLITLAGSIIYDRFFCKYLCPVGALYGLIGKASPYAVRINHDSCLQCGLCTKICPMNVDVMNCKSGKITDIECINCNECVNICPREDALYVGFRQNKKFHPLIATILVLSLFFVPLLIAGANGSMQLLPNKYYRTEAVHEEEPLESSAVVNGQTAGDIQGSMTMTDVAKALNMPLDEIYSKMGLSSGFPSMGTIKSAALSKGAEFEEFKLLLFE